MMPTCSVELASSGTLSARAAIVVTIMVLVVAAPAAAPQVLVNGGGRGNYFVNNFVNNSNVLPTGERPEGCPCCPMVCMG